MGLPIKQNNVQTNKRKSVIEIFTELNKRKFIDDKTLNHFIEKVKEAGELTMSMNNILDREKLVREELKKTDAYQKKMKIAKWKKEIKAAQDSNNDELQGAIGVILAQVGKELPSDVKKQLMM